MVSEVGCKHWIDIGQGWIGENNWTDKTNTTDRTNRKPRIDRQIGQIGTESPKSPGTV